MASPAGLIARKAGLRQATPEILAASAEVTRQKEPDPVAEVHEQIAGLLGQSMRHPGGRSRPGCARAGRHLDHEQHVQALEEDRVYGEEVAGQ